MKKANYSIVPVLPPRARSQRLRLWIHKHGPDWLAYWIRRHSPAFFPWIVEVKSQTGYSHIRMASRKLAMQQLAHNLEQGRIARIRYDWIAVVLGWFL